MGLVERSFGFSVDIVRCLHFWGDGMECIHVLHWLGVSEIDEDSESRVGVGSDHQVVDLVC